MVSSVTLIAITRNVLFQFFDSVQTVSVSDSPMRTNCMGEDLKRELARTTITQTLQENDH
jgi:hypothetical protein